VFCRGFPRIRNVATLPENDFFLCRAVFPPKTFLGGTPLKSRIAFLAAAAGLILVACDSSTGSNNNGGNPNPTSTVLVVDQEQAVNVAASGTVTYTFVAGAQSGYQISTTTSSTTTGLVVTLYDSTGRLLDQTTASKSYLTYRNTGGSPATYTVTIKNTGSSVVGTLLRLTQTDGPDKYEPDNSRAEATLISTDSVVQSHILQAGDDDWYKFDVQAGKAYRVVVSSSFSGEFYLYPDSTSTSQTYSSSSSASIKPTKTGRMFLDFSGYSSTSSGAYKVAIYLDTAGVDKYEPDDTRAQATLITTDSAVQSHYLQAGEDDWYKFDAQAGKSYKVTVSSSFTGESYVYADSATTSSSQTYSSSSTYTVKAAKTGRMFVDFSGYSTSYTGAYKIAISVDTAGVDKYEPDDTRATATLITTDSAVQTHYLQAGEDDWYKFEAQAGKTYKVTTSSSFTGESYVYADSATTSSQTYSSSSTYTVKAAKTGRMFVDFSGYSTSYTGAYKIAISVDTTGVDKYEPDDTRAQATLITTDSVSQSHYLQAGEHDWLKFKADSGKTYKVTIGNFSDGRFYVYPDSASTSYLLSTTSTSGSVKATKSGTMFIDFYGYSTSYSGAYKIAVSVDTTGIDKFEPDDSKAKANLITTDGVSQSHFLQVGDTDWVKFKVDSGSTYVLSTSGAASTYMHLYADSTTTSYYTGSTSVSLKATKSGTFFANVAGYYSSSTGAYTVSVSGTAPVVGADSYEPDNTMGTASTISVGGTQSHHLQPGEHDWVKFSGTSGNTYLIHVVTPDGNVSVDYEVFDASSSSIIQGGSDGFDATVSVSTSGTFYVDLSGVNSTVNTDYTVKVSLQ
jgi:predicted metal-dependent phosphotriesterase family hydrolase